jgi:hypothetical protein
VAHATLEDRTAIKRARTMKSRQVKIWATEWIVTKLAHGQTMAEYALILAGLAAKRLRIVAYVRVQLP